LKQRDPSSRRTKDEIATEAVATLRAELDLMAQQIRITMGER
jgi:hypothetical protein